MDSIARYPIHEVFSSIQGEGAFVGEPQVFVRLEGCPLRCAWCDTPHTWTLPKDQGGAPDWQASAVRSWCSPTQVAERIKELDPSGRRSVSITGGEPLMWPGFIRALRGLLPERRLHLETAGAFTGALRELIGILDHVSADLKLPQDLAPPVALFSSTSVFESAPQNAQEWRLERRVLLTLLSGRDACLKMVVAAGHPVSSFEEILADVAELAPDLLLFLQPVTPQRKILAPDESTLESLAQAGEDRGLNIRVLPQVHALLGIR
jgi:7-carboxy-7-deazaguanine synthase